MSILPFSIKRSEYKVKQTNKCCICRATFEYEYYAIWLRGVGVVIREVTVMIKLTLCQSYYLQEQMRFNSLSEVLFAAATSQDQLLRSTACLKLEELREVDSKGHLEEIMLLLRSPQEDLHIIAYSYILNGWILKHNRLNYDLTPRLEALYQELSNAHAPVRLVDSAIRFRVQNLVKLAAAFYSKQHHASYAEGFLRRLATASLKHEGAELMGFHREVLEGMNQLLLRQSQVAMGAKIAGIIVAALNEILGAQERESFKYGIELSYYLPIFSCGLLQRMLPLLTQLSPTDTLLWKIVGRLRAAFIEDRFNPPFESAIEAYRVAKLLARSFNLSTLSEIRSSQLEGPEKVLEVMQELLGLIYGTLSCTLRANMNSDQHKLLEVEVLNLHEYDSMVSWLIEACSLEESEDETGGPLRGFALKIIDTFSERMSEADLAIYYQRVRDNMNPSNQEQLLWLLLGGSKEILDLFDCQSMVTKIISYNFEIAARGSCSYYLFIGKFLKLNEYAISSRLFEDICEFVMRHLSLQEEQLNGSDSDRHTTHHLLKISYLLVIGTQLVNYPWTEQCSHALPYLVKKIFYYLANSIFGLPEDVHENLFEAVLAVIRKRNEAINSMVFDNAVEVYADCFLKQREGLEVGRMNLMCKVQQEFLIILREALHLHQLSDRHSRTTLHLIVNSPPENDQIIQKEIIALILRIVSLSNTRLAGLMPQSFEEASRNHFQIYFEKIASVFADSLRVHQPLQDVLEYLQGNYEQMFWRRVHEVETDFSTAVLLLLELSCRPAYHQFLDWMVVEMLMSFEGYCHTAEKIVSKSRNKCQDVRQAASKIVQMVQLVNCLLESLYLNPLWRSPELVSAQRMTIASHPQFVKCKNSVDALYATSLTDMMRHVSLNEPNKSAVFWSKRYEQILRESPARSIIDDWFANFKAS